MGFWSMHGEPGTRPRRCAVLVCAELLPLDVDDRITGADDDEVEC